MKFLTPFFLVLIVLFTSCAQQSEPQAVTLEEQVASLVEEKKFDEAISLLQSADNNEPTVVALLAKTHLDYGIYIEYDNNEIPMRDKMTGALRQYIEVLKLEPENEKAIAEIDQIIGIYQTMPGRTLPADILDELRARGLDGGIQPDAE
jgi:hypothetical protein